MSTTHLEIQWIKSQKKNLKPSATKETTKIMHKSIILKIDKIIKYFSQEHLYLTTIDNNNPKLDITGNCVREMAHLQNYS